MEVKPTDLSNISAFAVLNAKRNKSFLQKAKPLTMLNKKNIKSKTKLVKKAQNVSHIKNATSKVDQKKKIKKLKRLKDTKKFVLKSDSEKLRQLSEKTDFPQKNKSDSEDSSAEFNRIHFETLRIEKTESNPIEDGKTLFQWMIKPFNAKDFFKKYWEKKPLFIQRKSSPNYYKHLMSTPLLDSILRENYILFSKNIDVTTFVDDKRETHNPPGRALPSVVWDYFLNGCSVRFLNPQTYIPKLHTLNATLQEFFNCFIGANSYLTPPNSQGFAPHYDDIEAFILQIEGKKRWRVYKPKCDNDFLPRYSSPNFSQKELGKPILDVIVSAGDLLYFPRGYIHQGDTVGFETHSLHVTISAYQKNSWGDFLEKLVPASLKDAIENDVKFREGLPLNYLSYVGFVHSDSGKKCKERQEFIEKTKTFLNNMLQNHLVIDSAADEMAKNHIHDYLPPVLDQEEKICSVYEGGEKMTKKGVINRVEIEPDTFVRLARAHCARLVEDIKGFKLYYSSENSKEYHEYESNFLEVDTEFVAPIREIILQYPKYVRVEELPVHGLDKKIQIVQDLWEKGILIGKHPLPVVED